MALSHSPQIVTSGLVYCSDPASPRSYSGTGTTLLDVSGSNNTGTLTNGPTYTSGISGYFSYDGVDDYTTIPTLTGLPTGASAGTLCAWAYANLGATGIGWIISYGAAATSQSRFIGQFGTTYYFGGYGNDITASGLVTNTWFYMVGVYDGTNASMYINGSLVSGPTAKTWNTGSTNFQLGRQTNGGEYWNGRIAHASIYNIALTATQVSQNFNALRGRYGI